MVTLDFIESEALQLPTDQRLALAQRILTSVEPLFSVDVEAAWEEEIKARIAQLDAGQVESSPADEVFAALDRH